MSPLSDSSQNFQERLSPLIEETIKNHPPLTAEAERRLFETMPREFAEQTVVLHSLGYAAKTARKWRIPNASYDDTFQYVVCALVKAIKAYDISKCDPDMRFTGLARTVVDREMLKLCSPNSNLADTKMNLLTSPLSRELVEEHDEGEGYGSLMEALVEQGKDIAGIAAPESQDLDPNVAFDRIMEAMKEFKEEEGFSTPKKREGFYNDIRIFLRSASGVSLDAIAREEGSPKDTVRSSVNRIRMLFVRLALSKKCPDEWKWLFDKSYTIKASRPIQDEIKGFSNEVAWKRISSERSGKVIIPHRYDRMLGKKFNMHNKKEQAVPTAMDAPAVLARANGTFNYDKMLSSCYQRKYKLTTTHRPARGNFYSEETNSVKVSSVLRRRISVLGSPGNSLFPGTEPKTFPPQAVAQDSADALDTLSEQMV